jgi:hypothetical protein
MADGTPTMVGGALCGGIGRYMSQIGTCASTLCLFNGLSAIGGGETHPWLEIQQRGHGPGCTFTDSKLQLQCCCSGRKGGVAPYRAVAWGEPSHNLPVFAVQPNLRPCIYPHSFHFAVENTTFLISPMKKDNHLLTAVPLVTSLALNGWQLLNPHQSCAWTSKGLRSRAPSGVSTQGKAL